MDPIFGLDLLEDSAPLPPTLVMDDLSQDGGASQYRYGGSSLFSLLSFNTYRLPDLPNWPACCMNTAHILPLFKKCPSALPSLPWWRWLAIRLSVDSLEPPKRSIAILACCPAQARAPQSTSSLSSLGTFPSSTFTFPWQVESAAVESGAARRSACRRICRFQSTCSDWRF